MASKMNSSVQIVTVPTADTPGTTIIFRTQKHNYIFGNQGEGTQRAFTQVGARLIKVQDFFLTGRMRWRDTGGLIGMLLTLADSQMASYETVMQVWRKRPENKRAPEPPRPKVNIYGPPNLKHALAACRRFIFRKGVPITATEYKDVPPQRTEQGQILPSWQDDQIRVWSMSISPSTAESPSTVESSVEAEAELSSKRHIYEKFLNTFHEFGLPQGEESADDRELRYDRIRTAVLNHMFNSTWNFDTLVEKHISEVEMPAAMFVRNPETHRMEPYGGPVPGGKDPLPDVIVWVRTPWPGAKVLALPPTSPTHESVSYIIRTHAARGKFDVKRAIQLGVQQGPDFSRLTAGQTVTSNTGEIITPEMVLGPDRPGQGIAILDVPSLPYLDTLVNREELQSDYIMDGIGACIWILGPGLASHPAVHQSMKKLNKLQHIISGVDVCPNRLTFDSVAAQTIRLGQIDPSRYHLSFHDNDKIPQDSLYGRGLQGGALPPDALVADRCLTINIMPTFKVSKDAVPSFLDISEVKETTSVKVIEAAEAARQDVAQDSKALQAWKLLVARPDTEVITLGTGSSIPSKYRNVSATLVRVPGIGNYLFDCGEGTLGQLQRVFNPEELVDIIKNLRMIWISHLHADHHLGTVTVIREWYRIVHGSVPSKRWPKASSLASKVSDYGLSVVSHEGMVRWLWEYSSVEDFGFSRILPLEISPVERDAPTGTSLTMAFAPGPQMPKGNWVLKPKDYEAIFGLSDIQACRVAHCHGAMAVSLTFPSSPSDPEPTKPLKVSYSGDCRPSSVFGNIGHNTTVLIHEATFDDELQGDAVAKKHSTTSEALSVGARMDAKAVVLTHFSQRYQKIPILQTVDGTEEGEGVVDDTEMEGAAEGEQVLAEDDSEDPTPDNMDIHPSNPSTAPPVMGPDNVKADHAKRTVIKVRAKDMKVAIAFDYMRVKIGEIAELEKFSDALNTLLVEEEEEEGIANNGEEIINGNGKKTSGDEEGGGKKKKKSKRNN